MDSLGKGSAKRLSVNISCPPFFVSLFLVILIMLSSCPANALVQTHCEASSTATVSTPSVTLDSGASGVGSSTITSGIYASTQITAGIILNVNQPTVATFSAPSYGVKVGPSAFNNKMQGVTGTLNAGTNLIYVVVSIKGTN